MEKIHRFDMVEVVNYGHWLLVQKDYETSMPLIQETEGGKYVDMLPELVGKIGVVSKISGGRFSVSGIKGKESWYDREQLKLIPNVKPS